MPTSFHSRSSPSFTKTIEPFPVISHFHLLRIRFLFSPFRLFLSLPCSFCRFFYLFLPRRLFWRRFPSILTTLIYRGRSFAYWRIFASFFRPPSLVWFVISSLENHFCKTRFYIEIRSIYFFSTLYFPSNGKNFQLNCSNVDKVARRGARYEISTGQEFININ